MKYLRFALFPFAILYGLIVRFRNHLYDIGSKKSVEFDLPVLCVGNLVAGGSGKTPMVEYLIRKFSDGYKISTLSRGYGRKTRGFKLATQEDNHLTIGDEPYQIYRKFGDKVYVAVGEERAMAIPEILFADEHVNLVVLDDAYQHRAVRPYLNILLTDFSKPFYEDHLLPAGMLREPRSGAKRADFVVVTKCPEDLSISEAQHVKSKIAKYAKDDAQVFFTGIKYASPKCFAGKGQLPQKMIVVTGIANPKPFLSFLHDKFEVVEILSFPDHYKFRTVDIQKIILTAQKKGDEVGVITTEKDYVRLLQFEEQILRSNISFFYVPITFKFLFEENKFDKMLSDAIIAFERKDQ